MNLWLGASALLCLVLAGLAWRVLRGRVRDDGSAREVYRLQQQALQGAAEAGEVDPALLPGLHNELARASLEDASREARAAPVSPIERQSLALLIGIVLPAVALPLYLQFGHPAPAPDTGKPPHMSAEDMVAELERRIARDPRDAEPRMWLARVRMAQGDYAGAIQVFEALLPLAPAEPAVLLQYADALSMAAQGRIGPKARELIARALDVDPRNLVGLWLAGVAADQAGEPQQALDFLTRAREAGAALEQPTDELDALIADVAARAGLPVPVAPPATAETAAATAPDATPARPGGDGTTSTAPNAEARIDVAVTVAAGMAADLPADTVVYVLAKAVNGPPMPLAVKRMTLGELPATVRLDDSLAMAPQFRLSSATDVVVTARVSRSGEPVARSGDLQGSSATLKVGRDTAVDIAITDEVP